MADTCAHELFHAIENSLLNSMNMNWAQKWLMEMLAVYAARSEVTGDLTYMTYQMQTFYPASGVDPSAFFDAAISHDTWNFRIFIVGDDTHKYAAAWLFEYIAQAYPGFSTKALWDNMRLLWIKDGTAGTAQVNLSLALYDLTGRFLDEHYRDFLAWIHFSPASPLPHDLGHHPDRIQIATYRFNRGAAYIQNFNLGSECIGGMQGARVDFDINMGPTRAVRLEAEYSGNRAANSRTAFDLWQVAAGQAYQTATKRVTMTSTRPSQVVTVRNDERLYLVGVNAGQFGTGSCPVQITYSSLYATLAVQPRRATWIVDYRSQVYAYDLTTTIPEADNIDDNDEVMWVINYGDGSEERIHALFKYYKRGGALANVDWLHSYRRPGDYPVRVQLLHFISQAVLGEWTQTLTVPPPPVATLTCAPNQLRPGESVTLTASVTPVPAGASYRWTVRNPGNSEVQQTTAVPTLSFSGTANLGLYRAEVLVAQGTLFLGNATTSFQVMPLNWNYSGTETDDGKLLAPGTTSHSGSTYQLNPTNPGIADDPSDRVSVFCPPRCTTTITVTGPQQVTTNDTFTSVLNGVYVMKITTEYPQTVSLVLNDLGPMSQVHNYTVTVAYTYGDGYEPNETTATATPWTADVVNGSFMPLPLSLHSAGDVDVFGLTVPYGRSWIRVTLSQLPTNYEVALLNSAGTEVAAPRYRQRHPRDQQPAQLLWFFARADPPYSEAPPLRTGGRGPLDRGGNARRTAGTTPLWLKRAARAARVAHVGHSGVAAPGGASAARTPYSEAPRGPHGPVSLTLLALC